MIYCLHNSSRSTLDSERLFARAFAGDGAGECLFIVGQMFVFVNSDDSYLSV
jgi:hypothetical protein